MTTKTHSEKYFKPAIPVRDVAICLDRPKFAHNVGMNVRVAAYYCVEQVMVTGQRIKDEVDRLNRVPREERLRGYADVLLSHTADPISLLDEDVVPVAVEFRPNSELLYDFEHPQKALYIFGPEDGSVDPALLTKCHRFVKIDTSECLNLSIAVATVLYDREAKLRKLRELANLTKPTQG